MQGSRAIFATPSYHVLVLPVELCPHRVIQSVTEELGWDHGKGRSREAMSGGQNESGQPNTEQAREIKFSGVLDFVFVLVELSFELSALYLLCRTSKPFCSSFFWR